MIVNWVTDGSTPGLDKEGQFWVFHKGQVKLFWWNGCSWLSNLGIVINHLPSAWAPIKFPAPPLSPDWIPATADNRPGRTVWLWDSMRPNSRPFLGNAKSALAIFTHWREPIVPELDK